MDIKPDIQIFLDLFDDDVLLKDKLIRMRNFLMHQNLSDDLRGFILENNELDEVFVDGSGFRESGQRTRKETSYFRPAISLDGKNLKLYTVPSFGNRGGNSRHEILTLYESPAWIFCDVDSFEKNTKFCHFTPYNTVTAQYVEEQWNLGKKKYSFSLKIDNKKVDYNISSTKDPTVFVQKRSLDKTIQRDVLRITNKEAREMQIKREIKSLAPKHSSARDLLNVLLESPLDITKFDTLFEDNNSKYNSVNYELLIEQRNIFNDNYGNLTRLEAYHIMSELESLNSTLIIKFD